MVRNDTSNIIGPTALALNPAARLGPNQRPALSLHTTNQFVRNNRDVSENNRPSISLHHTFTSSRSGIPPQLQPSDPTRPFNPNDPRGEYPNLGGQFFRWSSFNAASQNIRSANTLVDTSAGSLTEINLLLDTARRLAQAAADTPSLQDQQRIQADIDSILDSIDAIQATSIQTMNRSLSGAASASFSAESSRGIVREVASSIYFHVGVNAGDGWWLELVSVDSTTLALRDPSGNPNLNVIQADASQMAAVFQRLDDATSFVLSERANLGAARSRLSADAAQVNLQQSQLNPIRPESAARDRMQDFDPEAFERMRTIMLLQWLAENVRNRHTSGEDPLLAGLSGFVRPAEQRE